MVSPLDCAKAASERAREHMAINLQIIFFMVSPKVLCELPRK
jgi:hypothetical protein